MRFTQNFLESEFYNGAIKKKKAKTALSTFSYFEEHRNPTIHFQSAMDYIANNKCKLKMLNAINQQSKSIKNTHGFI